MGNDTKEKAISKFSLVTNKQQAMNNWKLYEDDAKKSQLNCK